jgi:hypothetical protein
VVTVKNAIFWNVMPCGFVRTNVLEERIASIIRVIRIDELGTTLAVTSNQRMLQRNTAQLWLLVTANFPNLLILVTLMMEAIRSSEHRFLQEPHGITSQKTVFFKSIWFAKQKFKTYCGILRLPLWSGGQSSWLLTQRSRVRFPTLPDFLSSSGSGMGSTQPL